MRRFLPGVVKRGLKAVWSRVIVLDRQVKRPQLSWRERGIMVLLASKLRTWEGALP